MTKNGGDCEPPIEFRQHRFVAAASTQSHDPMEEIAHFSLGGLRAPFAFDTASNGIVFKKDHRTVIHLNLATNETSTLHTSDSTFEIFSLATFSEHGLVVCLSNSGLLYIATATVTSDRLLLESPKFSGIKCSVYPENGDTLGHFSMAVTPDKNLLQVLSLENTFLKQMPSQYLIEVKESKSTENVKYRKEFFSFSHHIFQISCDNRFIRKSLAGIGKILTTQTFELKGEEFPPPFDQLLIVQCDEDSLLGIFSSSDVDKEDVELAQLWQLEWSSCTWHCIPHEIQHPHWPVSNASLRVHSSEVFVVGDCGVRECTTKCHLFKFRLRHHKNHPHLSAIPEERFSDLLNAASCSSSFGSVDDSDLDDVLECSVCQTIFENPKQLICGHTFCEKCCQKMASETAIVCPLCRSETPLNGSLPTNYILKQVVGKFKRQRMRMSRLVPCSVCSESLHNERIFACRSCHEDRLIENAICARCGLTRHGGHNVVPLEILSHLDKENLTYSLSSLASNSPSNADLVQSIGDSLRTIKANLETTLAKASEHSAILQTSIEETTRLPFITKEYSNRVWTRVSKSGQTLKEIHASLQIQANSLKKCGEVLDKFVNSV